MTHVEKYPFPQDDSATYSLDTPIGQPFIRSLGEHIGVAGGIPHNTEEGEAGALTINGVAYSVQGHFHRWADGRYHAGAEDSRERWREPSLSRRHYDPNKSYAQNEPTRAAVERARSVLEDAVNAWAAAHPDAILSGQDRKRAQDAHTLAKQLDDCEQACAVLRANLRACVAGKGYESYPLAQSPQLKR